jgi:hypothetical protein
MRAKVISGGDFSGKSGQETSLGERLSLRRKPDRFSKSVRFVVANLGRCPHRTMRVKVISGSDFSGKSGQETILEEET